MSEEIKALNDDELENVSGGMKIESLNRGDVFILKRDQSSGYVVLQDIAIGEGCPDIPVRLITIINGSFRLSPTQTVFPYTALLTDYYYDYNYSCRNILG